MSFFTEEAFDVLEEFSANNTKEWFGENKSRYEETVRKPFANLLAGVSERLAATDLPYSGGEKTMFRVNRDVRFSADKSPYNTRVSGLLTPNGTKSEAGALLYIHLEEDGGFAVGGLYKPPTPRLEELRTAMIEKEEDFQGCLDGLRSAGHLLDRSDATKTMPRGFNEFADHPFTDYIKLKNLMVRLELPKQDWLSEDLAQRLHDFALSARPLFAFLARN